MNFYVHENGLVAIQLQAKVLKFEFENNFASIFTISNMVMYQNTNSTVKSFRV